MRRLIALLLMTGLVATANAQEVRPFVSGSLEEIRAARAERAFVLGFWSLDCTYCPEELEMLAAAADAHPGLDIVLVSTDAPEDRPAVAARLAALGLDRAEAWLFGAAPPERLRFEIDRRWYGELPRTYLHAPGQPIVARSGTLTRAELEQWIAGHARRD